jgi:hypothetical protein
MEAQKVDADLLDEVRRKADQCCADLDSYGATVVRIGRLRLAEDESRRIAHAVMEDICARMKLAHGLAQLRVEVDAPQATAVTPGRTARTLLPHHDGQHCSYLTPSRCLVPDWDSGYRTFGTRHYTTTPAHKLIQAIFVVDPGFGISATTFFDWLAVLRDVRTARGLDDDLEATARWLGANFVASLSMRDRREDYPSVAGMLGCGVAHLADVSYHYAEEPVPPELIERFPQVTDLIASCPCGRCSGETERLFCHSLVASAGMTWDAFRARYERIIASERFDLVISHNLTMLHGGWAGTCDRRIEPLCLVMDEAGGEPYEAWLQSSWQRGWPS